MPRSVDPAVVRRWAELAVLGKTIAEIRKAHREKTGKEVDPRTIGRALEKTQAEIAERTATAAELQRGIRVHGEQLLAGVEPLAKAVRSTTSGRLNPHPTYAVDAGQLTIGSSTAEQRGDSWRIQIAGEHSIKLRLLREHLPKDKTWKMLEEFSGSTANWVTARVKFANEIKRELRKIPKKLGISSPTAKQPFELAGLTIIDAAAAAARVEGSHGIDDLLGTLASDTGLGGVSLGLTILSSLQVPDINDFRTAILDGVGTVMSSSVGQNVLTSRAAFDRTGANLLDELSMLKMTTYLPGTCKSCKRFRML